MRALLSTDQNTFAAGLDVRLKLLLCVGGSLVSIALSSPLGLGIPLVCSTLLVFGAARPGTIVTIYLLSGLMAAFALGFAALIALAVPDLMRWDMASLLVPFMRMLISINLLLVLAMSTPVQAVSARLQALRLPGWVHIPLSVAIRFIPTFLSDCAQIRDAARLRPGKGLRGLWRGLAVPLIFRVLYSADDLAMAAELKGINAAGRPRTGTLPGLGRRDRLVLALATLAVCAAVAVQYYGPSFNAPPM